MGGGPSYSTANPNTALLNTYMDLSASNQYTVSVTSDFFSSVLYLIFAGDNASGQFTAVNVNGTNYTGGLDGMAVGSDPW